ncbi:MAG: AAA family ATPase [Symbiobacteriaceae bacterium]|nr:AAA family ATPase [Symbiobacteriaceae bacterium]
MRHLAITVTFPKSSSFTFNEVLQEASAERSFVTMTLPSGEERYRVTYSLEGLDRYRNLWAKIRNWSQVDHQLDGTSVSYDGCQEMLDCACQGAALGTHNWCWGEGQQGGTLGSIAPLFSCRFIPISEANHLGWFQYGTLNRERVFVVDKIKLRQRISYYLDRACAQYCPLLDEGNIDAIVSRLPSRIDPRQDDAWVYKQGWIRGRYQTVGVEKRHIEGRVVGSSRPEAGERSLGTASPEDTPKDEATVRLINGRMIPKVTYQEVGGLDEVIAKLREAVELPLRLPFLFEHLGVTPHRGVLLYGPPGTGKTLLAKALANECEAHFILVNGPELLSKWHGETEANLRRIFDEARSKAPSVILFDEIDAMSPNRDAVTHNFEAVQVSQLLSLMDGLVERGNVVVVGTTNRPASVDPALKRPGRLELQLEIGLPDTEGRQAILAIHSAKMPLAEDVSLGELARQTSDYTGAMLEALCREAGMLCLREHLQIGKGSIPLLSEEKILELKVNMAHFLQALAEHRPPVKKVTSRKRQVGTAGI